MVQDNGEGLPGQDIGSIFYQKYEPKEILGTGVSSTVRRCVSKESGESFAVKIVDISQDLVDSDGLTLRQQILREVSILRLVAGHDNIIQLIDVFESATYIFLVFELCHNGELFDHLTSVVTLSEKRARRIMKQVLDAVQHCHSRNIVHRDLKPENILLDSDYNVKLTDFGFAKVLSPGERLYEVCGTPGYLAPELLKAGMVEKEECDGYNTQVDVWACGVILYTLLVGFPPFWHRKQLLMLRLIMEGKYSFSSPDWTSITEPPKDLINHLLVVDPNNRITVKQALQHPFLQVLIDDIPKATFNARRCFKLTIIRVRFLVRLKNLKLTPEPLSLHQAAVNPYSMRMFRRVIDGAAFQVYSHGVQRGEGQNRAALFEHQPKTDTKKGKKDDSELDSKAMKNIQKSFKAGHRQSVVDFWVGQQD
jgi:phosphorylase kinase gamma subunit